MRRQY